MFPKAELSSQLTVSTIQALAPLDRAADPRQETLGRLLRIPIGQQVQATVTSVLDDGSYLVRIAGTSARMTLPAGLKIGEALALTMVATAPRPTFSLQPDGSAQPSLSAAGRLIDRLLQASATASSPVLRGETPLFEPLAKGQAMVGTSHASALPGSSTDGKALAASLQSTIAGSGMFYESHVARWADGRFPLEDLRREPQARHGVYFQADVMPPGASQDPRHAQLASVIGAQLELLENQRFTWQGDAWPGQPVTWQVERRQEDDAPNDSVADPVWQSSVRFELPQLGTVAATLRLCGGRLQMQLNGETVATAMALNAHAGALVDALAGANLSLDSLTVGRHASRET